MERVQPSTAPVIPVDLDAAHALGVTDPGGTVHLQGETERVFDLASVSKPVTALGVLIAVERSLLDLDEPLVEALIRQPYRTIDPELLTDPTIYRFQELIQVYGPALKALIHEEFGDGIMSAIDFSMDIQRQSDPKGDRVNVVLSGKFLPYKSY